MTPRVGQNRHLLPCPLSEESDAALRRILSLKGDPFLMADWKDVVFLHFEVRSEILRPLVPAPLELELHQGSACVSLVALTMRRFRPFRSGSLGGWMFKPLGQQSFLNVRTYVRWGEEPGALFLWGWLSKPFGVGLPLGRIGLPCGFCEPNYDHDYKAGRVRGLVKNGASGALGTTRPTARFEYRAAIDPGVEFTRCGPGSLAEFAMERYAGFYCRRARPKIFRAWHEPWLAAPIDVTIKEDSLLSQRLPWFKEARLAGANFAPGFEGVWLGRAHGLEKASAQRRARRGVLSGFYEMP
jgi:uncharacterized protein YqjF (DUF2071 family)